MAQQQGSTFGKWSEVASVDHFDKDKRHKGLKVSIDESTGNVYAQMDGEVKNGKITISLSESELAYLAMKLQALVLSFTIVGKPPFDEQ